MNNKRKTFSSVAPEWYIPGLCRGATGFITRSDLGPMRLPSTEAPFGAAPAGYIPGSGRGATAFSRENAGAGRGRGEGPGAGRGVGPAAGGDVDRGDYSETVYDKWNGYQGSLFSNTQYDDEDQVADKEYDKVDQYLDGRRSAKRETRIKEEIEDARKKKPPVSHLFASCKRDVEKMSKEEWETLPEAPNYTVKRKKYSRYDYSSFLIKSRVMPIPDSVISHALDDMKYNTSVDAEVSGMMSRVPATPLTEVSIAKEKILNVTLNKAEDSVTGTSVVNKNLYLQDLGIVQPGTAQVEISDLKKARLLMKSVIMTKPNDPTGWIGAARIEEMDGRLQEARNILAQGCNACPDSDDIWLEAARLAPPDKCKSILAKAISQQSGSVKLWLAAANKESDQLIKSKILRRGLEYNSNSATLWKEAVKLAGEEEAKQLLRKAVECVPTSVDIWLALAKLETYDEAKVTLNRARMAVPTDHTVWIHAARLEEAQGMSMEAIDLKIRRCIKTLTKAQVRLSRSAWLQEAVKAEQAGSMLTCRAIVKSTMEIDVEPDEYKKVWLQNAAEACEKGAIETARALYAEACRRLPKKKGVWMRAFEFEKLNGTPAQVLDTMCKAIEANPDMPLFWLVYAKQLWVQGDFEKCREVLGKAREKHGDKEEIMLALIKFERFNKQTERVAELVKEGREKVGSVKLWKQSIMVEQSLGHIDQARALLKDALEKYPTALQMWMLGIRLESEENHDLPKAKELLAKAQAACGEHFKLAVVSARLDIMEEAYTRARTTLQDARQKYVGNEDVLLESVRLEQKVGNEKIASFLINKGLQDCPRSGKLWSEAIMLEPLHLRKAKGMDALKVCDQDERVVVAVACLFWEDLKMEKARKWFARSVGYNPLNGDPWAFYYKFEKKTGNAEIAEEVRKKCAAAQPRKGEHWKAVAKMSKNWFLNTDEILEKVVESIKTPE